MATDSRSFPRVPKSALAAREFVRGTLEEMSPGLDPAKKDTAVLLADELVTNAIVHTLAKTFEVEVDVGADYLRISVSDTARSRPSVRRPRPEDVHGRGLVVVNSLAREWGVEDGGQRTAGRKRVWFRLAATSQRKAPDPDENRGR